VGKLYSALFLSYLVISSVLCFCAALVIWALTRWWDRRLLILHYFSSFWAQMYIWIMPPWQVKIIGREKLQDQAMVMVSNHQSLLDILVVFGLFFPFKWVSKAENFKLPLIGWNMNLNRYIPIVRGDKLSALKMMSACKEALKLGSAVYFFPEGTRSATGLMKAFKPGAFALAHEMQVPIQLLVINGNKDALPKKSLEINGFHKIQLEVLRLIPYSEFAHLTIEETAVFVRNLILPHVKEHQTDIQAIELA
jgi:1-acyl-sn-glycerol-3-phosphate acyltransferase